MKTKQALSCTARWLFVTAALQRVPAQVNSRSVKHQLFITGPPGEKPECCWPEALLDNPIVDAGAEVWRMSVGPDKRNNRGLKQRENKGTKACVE